MSEELNEEIEEQQSEETAEVEEYNKVFFGEDDEGEGEEESTEEESADNGQGDDDELSESQGDAEVVEDDSKEGESEPEQLITLKWRGKEIQVTQQEAINMAQQNFDVTHKYQEVANMRKSAEADLELLELVKQGDKEALARLAKSGSIDPIDLLDIDMDSIEQGTQDPDVPFVSPEVEALMTEVAKDANLYNELADLEKSLPAPVVQTMAKDLNTFYTVINEVKSGDAGVVMPHVQARLAQLDDVDRSLVMNNADAFANLYVNVKQELMNQVQTQGDNSQPNKPTRSKVNPAEVSIRKSNTSKRSQPTKGDSMNSDSAYEKILERLNRQ